jgi:hypothetical protein
MDFMCNITILSLDFAVVCNYAMEKGQRKKKSMLSKDEKEVSLT